MRRVFIVGLVLVNFGAAAFESVPKHCVDRGVRCNQNCKNDTACENQCVSDLQRCTKGDTRIDIRAYPGGATTIAPDVSKKFSPANGAATATMLAATSSPTGIAVTNSGKISTGAVSNFGVISAPHIGAAGGTIGGAASTRFRAQ